MYSRPPLWVLCAGLASHVNELGAWDVSHLVRAHDNAGAGCSSPCVHASRYKSLQVASQVRHIHQLLLWALRLRQLRLGRLRLGRLRLGRLRLGRLGLGAPEAVAT